MPVAITFDDQHKAALIVRGQQIGLEQAIAQTIAEERERCAQIAEGLNGWGAQPAPELAEHIAKVIRESR